jgi:predicted phosphoribosyltransferase
MFEDRQQAGLLLAKLISKRPLENAVIFALPRGGVAVGAEIGQLLKLPVEIVVTRKIGHPYNPEYAIAAVSESGFVVENEQETSRVDEHWFERAIEVEQEEANRRRRIYLPGKLPKSLKGKTAIIVDDGLATGLTIKAAIKEIGSLDPNKLVVVVPVAPAETVTALDMLVNDVIVVKNEKIFAGAIGAYYKDFPQLKDEEVISLLKNH